MSARVVEFLAGLGGPWRGMWGRGWARDCWSVSERRQGRSMTSRGGASGGGSGLGVSTPLAADALDADALDADATGTGIKSIKSIKSGIFDSKHSPNRWISWGFLPPPMLWMPMLPRDRDQHQQHQIRPFRLKKQLESSSFDGFDGGPPASDALDADALDADATPRQGSKPSIPSIPSIGSSGSKIVFSTSLTPSTQTEPTQKQLRARFCALEARFWTPMNRLTELMELMGFLRSRVLSCFLASAPSPRGPGKNHQFRQSVLRDRKSSSRPR